MRLLEAKREMLDIAEVLQQADEVCLHRTLLYCKSHRVEFQVMTTLQDFMLSIRHGSWPACCGTRISLGGVAYGPENN